MRFVLVSLALLWSSQSLAECSEPEAPTIPDGAVSSQEEMVAGMQGLKGYMTASNEYLECLKAEEAAAQSAAEAAGEEYSDEAGVAQHNAIVDRQRQGSLCKL